MLNNQIDILSAELTRKLHTAVHKKMYSKYVDRKKRKRQKEVTECMAVYYVVQTVAGSPL